MTNNPAGNNPALIYITSLTSKHSQRVMIHALRVVLAIYHDVDIRDIDKEHILSFSWETLEYEQTKNIRSHLIQHYGSSSTNRILSALRGVLKEAWRLGYMTSEAYYKAIDIPNTREEKVLSGRDLSFNEIQALVSVCVSDTHQVTGIRDAAILAILYICGLRRSELCALDYHHYNIIENSLLIYGKGRKQRIVYLNDGARKALQDWLQHRGQDDGALFLPMRKNDKIVQIYQNGALVGIKPQTVYDLIKRRAKQADVRDFTPHDLRRTFVTHLLNQGVDIATIQKIVGHANINTTVRYDQRDEISKRNAPKKLHFPYYHEG